MDSLMFHLNSHPFSFFVGPLAGEWRYRIYQKFAYWTHYFLLTYLHSCLLICILFQWLASYVVSYFLAHLLPSLAKHGFLMVRGYFQDITMRGWRSAVWNEPAVESSVCIGRTLRREGRSALHPRRSPAVEVPWMGDSWESTVFFELTTFFGVCH